MMKQIRNMEKTIDIDALFRGILRKWKIAFLCFIIVAFIGGGMEMMEAAKDKNVVLSEEEKEEINKYHEYDLYIKKTKDIIDFLEENIHENLNIVASEKGMNENMIELADEIELLETYRLYYNSIINTQNSLKNNFNEMQNAYMDSIDEEKVDEELRQEKNVIIEIKRVIKAGSFSGMIAVGVWGFVMAFMFVVNKKIKSKEDILAICGDTPVAEGKRDLIKRRKVQIGNNLGIRELLSEKEFGIVNLAGEIVFDVAGWNDVLMNTKEKGEKEFSEIVLVAEIGVSSYESVFKVKEEYGDRMIGCLCLR